MLDIYVISTINKNSFKNNQTGIVELFEWTRKKTRVLSGFKKHQINGHTSLKGSNNLKKTLRVSIAVMFWNASFSQLFYFIWSCLHIFVRKFYRSQMCFNLLPEILRLHFFTSLQWKCESHLLSCYLNIGLLLSD